MVVEPEHRAVGTASGEAEKYRAVSVVRSTACRQAGAAEDQGSLPFREVEADAAAVRDVRRANCESAEDPGCFSTVVLLDWLPMQVTRIPGPELCPSMLKKLKSRFEAGSLSGAADSWARAVGVLVIACSTKRTLGSVLRILNLGFEWRECPTVQWERVVELAEASGAHRQQVVAVDLGTSLKLLSVVDCR
jgi:hypothetical protein